MNQSEALSVVRSLANGVDPETIGRVSSEGDLERARAILARKYREPATTREERAKRMRFLQSRGFTHETIRRALREPAAEDENE